MTATIIQMSVQRMACTVCGAEANASCNCGKPYAPVKERVAKYDKDNPGQTTRKVAEAVGTTAMEVSRARKAVVTSVTTVTGKDGKTYKAKRPAENPKVYQNNSKNVFLLNCAASRQAAKYVGKVDVEVRTAARRVAQAWKKLADELEKRT